MHAPQFDSTSPSLAVSKRRVTMTKKTPRRTIKFHLIRVSNAIMLYRRLCGWKLSSSLLASFSWSDLMVDSQFWARTFSIGFALG